jgi:hypothetical protein
VNIAVEPATPEDLAEGWGDVPFFDMALDT